MYIYDKKTLKIVTKLDLSKEEFLKDTEKYFKEYDKKTMIISEDYIAYPKLNEDGLREKTIEEKIIEDKKIELLQNGEYIEDNKIIQVPNPSTKYLKYNWNKEIFTWELVTTKEELVRIRSEKVKRAHELRNDIITFTEFGGCEDEIELAQKEIDELMPEINKLAELMQEVKTHEHSK